MKKLTKVCTNSSDIDDISSVKFCTSFDIVPVNSSFSLSRRIRKICCTSPLTWGRKKSLAEKEIDRWSSNLKFYNVPGFDLRWFSIKLSKTLGSFHVKWINISLELLMTAQFDL